MHGLIYLWDTAFFFLANMNLARTMGAGVALRGRISPFVYPIVIRVATIVCSLLSMALCVEEAYTYMQDA